MAEKSRGTTLTIFAILFTLIAISNFLKPFHLFSNDGFVLLGTKLSGTANEIAGPLFGTIILLYAYAIWAMRKFALPIAYSFVLCVILNMVMFSVRNYETRSLPTINIVVGIGVPLAAAIVLSRRSADLTGWTGNPRLQRARALEICDQQDEILFRPCVWRIADSGEISNSPHTCVVFVE